MLVYHITKIITGKIEAFKFSKVRRIAVIFVITLFSLNISQGQVLISLLLGDKLNTGDIEFGLEGGVNWSNITNIDPSGYVAGFHLGFYFDFRLNDKLFVHTGVIVKSPMGAKNLDPYSLSEPGLDSLLVTSSVKRNLRYFNVPGLIKYKFSKHFFCEGGIQVGLLYKAFDEFKETVFQKDDLQFTNEIRDNYKRLDAGVVVGFGYRLMKGNGINLGARYYYGLVDILKDNTGPPQRNSSIYLYAGIPIGAGKAKKKAGQSE
jgi:long-subunit fatty acid transport protein